MATDLPFAKMHGCGNDYVYLDGFRDRLPPEAAWPDLAVAMSDRHRGIGSDGLIVVRPHPDADAEMVMLNSDGSRSEMCGNGLRCATRLAWDRGHVPARTARMATGAGILAVEPAAGGGARVSMGRPRLAPELVPVLHPGPGPRLDLELEAAGHRLAFQAVGMGNPHAVCVVPDPDTFPVAAVGPRIEHHQAFPRRTNVEFTARLSDEDGWPVIRQRTWERGAGETLACGTGACAVAVAWIQAGRIPGRRAIVRLSGGDLRIAWPADDADVVMEGPATWVFEGRWPLAH
ncbi:MAG: hypothetical protein RLZZ127_349 [Planctomycetota bacterium]|jgi:diaminopimelate epimerase